MKYAYVDYFVKSIMLQFTPIPPKDEKILYLINYKTEYFKID